MEDVHTRRGGSYWILSIGRLLIFYAISWGPVIAVYSDHEIPDWAEKLYRPMSWLQSRPVLNKPMVSYLHWWAQVLEHDESANARPSLVVRPDAVSRANLRPSG